jgi:hypothetical protein
MSYYDGGRRPIANGRQSPNLNITSLATVSVDVFEPDPFFRCGPNEDANRIAGGIVALSAHAMETPSHDTVEPLSCGGNWGSH